MPFKNFTIFCVVLLMVGEAFAQTEDMVAAPQTEAVTAEKKTSEIMLTSIENVDIRQVDGREQIFTKDENPVPFSGALQRKNEDGLLVTYFYRNGLKHGVAVAYAEDGHLELETTYSKGYKNGEEITFYENAKPKLKQTFVDDVLNGEEVIFYNNGKPERLNHYVDGKLEGEAIYFDREGNTVKKETYKDNKKNGVEHIISNNMLKEENNYVDNVLEGVSKRYHQQYLTDEILYKDGKRNGISKHYLENGSWSELMYKDDVLNGISRSFYPDKNVAESVTYAENQRNGQAEKFNQQGLRISAENYKNGKLEGVSRKFNENGELVSVAYYVNGIEMAVVNLDENTELRDIYTLYKQKSLSRVISNKSLWYPILWLGINLEKTDILAELENQMKMYSFDISDFAVFKRESKSKYEDYNRKLYFGLTPLSYAVNITAPAEILQKFADNSANIDMQNPRGTTALIEAVRLNNIQMIKYLLAHGADVSTVYGGGNTILLYAIKEKAQKDIIAELLKAGADPNVADSNGQTPLTLAIAENNAFLTDILLQNNADIKAKTSTGKTILAYAFENNVDSEIFSRLILGGADINEANEDGNILLMQALSAGNYDVAEKLLQNGADTNMQNSNGDSALSYVLAHDVPENILNKVVNETPDPLKNMKKYNKPVWKILAEQGRYDLLKSIVKKIGGVNIKDENGETVFEYYLANSKDENLYEIVTSFLSEKEVSENSWLAFRAVENKNLPLLKKLVELGVDVNAENANNEPLLTYLLNNKYPLEYIEAIENGKLELNKVKALETAIKNDDLSLAENLIKNGADVNLLTADNSSYLMILNNTQEKMTELLLKNGADINYSPQQDKILLMYAVKQGNLTLINHLIEKGFSVLQADADGNDSLMYVAEMIAQYAHLESKELSDLVKKIVAVLQANGADINEQNSNGETLLIRTAKVVPAKYAEIADTIVSLGADGSKKDQYGKTSADYVN